MINIDHLIAFEEGTATDDEILSLFSDLVRGGAVWHLQGTYGRIATDLIEAGLLAPDGTILDTEEAR